MSTSNLTLDLFKEAASVAEQDYRNGKVNTPFGPMFARDAAFVFSELNKLGITDPSKLQAKVVGSGESQKVQYIDGTTGKVIQEKLTSQGGSLDLGGNKDVNGYDLFMAPNEQGGLTLQSTPPKKSSWVKFRDDVLKPAAAIAAAYFLGPEVLAALEGTGAAAAGTAAAGEGILAGTTAADIMAATEALEAASNATLAGGASASAFPAASGVPAALTGAELAAAGAGAELAATAPAAAGTAAPASVTVAATPISATPSLLPAVAGAGVLGALTLPNSPEAVMQGAGTTTTTTPEITEQQRLEKLQQGAAAGAGASILKQLADATGLSEDTLKMLLQGGAGLLGGAASYYDAKAAREAARGASFAPSSGLKAVTGKGGATGFKKAASGGVMSVLNEKGPEDYGIESLLDREMFMEANMPAGENTQYDIYGNMIMPDPYLRSMTVGETDQTERDAMREYYKNPENEKLSYDIRKNLEDAVIARGGMGEIDVQETLRNIYNTPEGQNIFFNYTDQLKYAPSDATELILKDIGLDAREAEGFTPDTNSFVPRLAYDLSNFDQSNPKIGQALEREMLKLIDPNAPRTFFRDYNQKDFTEVPNIGGGGGEGSGGSGSGGGGAAGGVASLIPSRMARGRYLDGHSDGMADKVPASIEGRRPAALSDGEFVIPADVVSHLGNGNSNAGAKRLYEMMDRIRGARTGNTKQGKQINPNKFLPR
jgi:hypothetical protein